MMKRAYHLYAPYVPDVLLQSPRVSVPDYTVGKNNVPVLRAISSLKPYLDVFLG